MIPWIQVPPLRPVTDDERARMLDPISNLRVAKAIYDRGRADGVDAWSRTVASGHNYRRRAALGQPEQATVKQPTEGMGNA